MIDTDDEIEKDQGCSIEQIFSYAGEPFFRELEYKKLLELRSVQNTIIATGGGIVMQEANWEMFKKIGPTVYLKTSSQKIFDRLKDDAKRPLLKNQTDPWGFLNQLLEEREKYYTRADLIVDTDNLELNQLCHKIIHNFHLNSAKSFEKKSAGLSSAL